MSKTIKGSVKINVGELKGEIELPDSSSTSFNPYVGIKARIKNLENKSVTVTVLSFGQFKGLVTQVEEDHFVLNASTEETFIAYQAIKAITRDQIYC